VFLVISVYFNLSNILPKSGTFPLGHPVFINDLSNATQHSKYLLFAYDFKIFRAINFVDACILLQSYNECI